MGKKVRTKAACDILGCCPNTLRRWTEEGKFKVYRSGKSGNRRWDEDDLRRYLGEKVDEPEVETKLVLVWSSTAAYRPPTRSLTATLTDRSSA